MGGAYTQFRSFVSTEKELNSELIKMQQQDSFTILSVTPRHLKDDVSEYNILFHVTVRSTENNANTTD